MIKTCKDCSFFDNSGYRDHKETQHVGFCSRFCETTNKDENTCSKFNQDFKMSHLEKQCKTVGLDSSKIVNLVTVENKLKEIEKEKLREKQSQKEIQLLQNQLNLGL